MTVRDILMTSSCCVVTIMSDVFKAIGIDIDHFDISMLSEDLLESSIRKFEPDGNRIKVWLENKEVKK
jgi:hypothetical protein